MRIMQTEKDKKMKKYAKITDDKSQRCVVLVNDQAINEALIKEGFSLREVEQGYDFNWYVQGFAPLKPQALINRERLVALLNKLKETDYIAAKIAEGAATKEEYAEIIENRQKWRDEINLLKSSPL